MMGNYYNKKGERISLEQWAALCNDSEHKRVALTELPDGKIVSTVWMGLDHSFGRGNVLIFETMVFPAGDNFRDLDCERYPSEQEALAGHQEMVKKWSGCPECPCEGHREC